MPDISSRTAGLLIERLATYSHKEIGLVLQRLGMSEKAIAAEKEPNRVQRATAGINDAVSRRDNHALVELVEYLVSNLDASSPGAWEDSLQRALRSDGWDLAVVESEAPGLWGQPTTKSTWEVRVLGDAALPLAPRLHGIERDLDRLGLTAARKHFEHAVTNHAAGKWEAANGQLRAAFEAVLLETAQQIKPGWHGSGGQVPDLLTSSGRLAPEEVEVIRALWKLSHSNGSHPGVSSDSESTFRLATVSSTLRFLIDTFL